MNDYKEYLKQRIKEKLKVIPDFPRKGIQFYDVSPLLLDSSTVEDVLELILGHFQSEKIQFDLVAGLESRGFLFGLPIALTREKGFVMIRKANKLPGPKISESYSLEYGEATLELSSEAISPGQRVLIVDDLIATGGSCQAACSLIRRAGGEVAGCAFLVELEGMGGRSRCDGHFFSVLSLPSC